VFLRHAFPAYFVMPGKCNANNMQWYRSFFKNLNNNKFKISNIYAEKILLVKNCVWVGVCWSVSG